ncbi:sensor histidine kinase [Geoalkalibacter sp.]|uniref:sensor histidine kinase n=1 Tax=Geoalkalibacter sp. TaxID=3041440 RepID=UPI00272E3573|nr:ATP-binding protein [Geoalkalibacter sp.]
MSQDRGNGRKGEEAAEQLHFLQCMDRINQVIHHYDDAEQMLGKALEAVLEIFACDRVWLSYPCDPRAAIYRIPVEVTRPEYPGAHARDCELPMKAGADLICARALAAPGAVVFDADSDPPLAPALIREFGVRSQLLIAIRPRVGQPWLFGMHQCSHRRVWTAQEQRLFEGAARRIGEGLSTLLLLRNLRESQERFDLAVAGSRDGLWDWPDTDREDLWWSPRTFELLGYAPGEVKPSLERFMGRVHPEDRSWAQALLDDHLRQGGRSLDVQCRILMPGGEQRWLRVRGMSLSNGQGRARRLSGSLQDLTEDKRTEEELRRYREQLEELVAARTEALRKSNAELERANQELEAFAYSVSHDLRTPLAPIIGFAELLQVRYGASLDERARGMLADIMAQGEKMLRLIDDLLNLARIAHAKEPPRLVRAEEVFVEVLRELSLEFPEAPSRVKLLSPLPSICMHRAQVFQLFSNLLGNALRYAGPQTGPVEVLGARGGGRLRLEVRDHGPGIPAEERERIFGVFYRGEGGKQSPGSGIGLAIVAKIARHYGGSAWLEETPGGGCTFVVEVIDDLCPEEGGKG